MHYIMCFYTFLSFPITVSKNVYLVLKLKLFPYKWGKKKLQYWLNALWSISMNNIYCIRIFVWPLTIKILQTTWQCNTGSQSGYNLCRGSKLWSYTTHWCAGIPPPSSQPSLEALQVKEHESLDEVIFDIEAKGLGNCNLILLFQNRQS